MPRFRSARGSMPRRIKSSNVDLDDCAPMVLDALI
jgi:hypothetical protein